MQIGIRHRNTVQSLIGVRLHQGKRYISWSYFQINQFYIHVGILTRFYKNILE